MAKAGLGLALLYFRFRQAEGKDKEFDPGDGYQLMKDGRVVVDAIAQSGSTKVLQEELTGLGARNVASAGRVVSGALPIKQIPKASVLPSLQGLRPSTAKTQPSESQQVVPAQPGSGEGGESSGLSGAALLLLGVLLLIEMS